MMRTKTLLTVNLLLVCLLVTGCCRTRGEIWEDSKSASRHVTRGFAALGGKHGESRQVHSRDEFEPYDDSCYTNDFIPLMNDEFPHEVAMADINTRQPSQSPGDPGSTIPGVDAFSDPNEQSGLANVFKHIRFPFDSNLIKGRQNFMQVARIADFMKKNPNQYIFVEGHCDERGSESYNLALGSRRANSVRNLLISEGVDPDRIFTISYGKEKPVAFDHTDDAHTLNRRAQFKVWQKG